MNIHSGTRRIDAVLRVLTEVRARMFAALAASTDPTTLPARAGTAGRSREQEPVLSQGDALSRVVSDVEAVQDALLRVLGRRWSPRSRPGCWRPGC